MPELLTKKERAHILETQVWKNASKVKKSLEVYIVERTSKLYQWLRLVIKILSVIIKMQQKKVKKKKHFVTLTCKCFKMRTIKF